MSHCFQEFDLCWQLALEQATNYFWFQTLKDPSWQHPNHNHLWLACNSTNQIEGGLLKLENLWKMHMGLLFWQFLWTHRQKHSKSFQKSFNSNQQLLKIHKTFPFADKHQLSLALRFQWVCFSSSNILLLLLDSNSNQ